MDSAIVLDNSVVMAWCFEDESNQYADQVLDSLQHVRAIVPSIWPLEVGNVLVVAERKERLKRTDCLRFLDLLSRLPIDIEQEGPDRLMREVYLLARDTGLSTYDASYLDLAMRKGLPLATLDKALAEAARDLNVELFQTDLT
ncbi:MAG: type II toxin-antitoxin system VapC family toxin [Deltaproteobacteria bacterium]|nr:type II toxin-antitoxin system VapC family toxin [Deltaproteobacteria bacterium]MBW1930029.1 type II toxin-antitoxin system VapC family toxin [Deltaproteobacteria bacterium]MBW2027039.1 type II toxin-antitoxin system VapC family toxin [Deltaproteobacteria bacterium]MBW2127208.1 type II toxin-antitoxin system VapC family toxin [Deltaproteobacteria bacterium]RLB19937.1 MAG: VapC toxin family PIN domain ribonuclease [Deltaproteobacteria bacterium]